MTARWAEIDFAFEVGALLTLGAWPEVAAVCACALVLDEAPIGYTVRRVIEASR